MIKNILTNYAFLLIPLTVMVFTQTTKVLIETIKEKFTWQLITAYGGLPSSHTALIVSLATIIGLRHGFTTATFALTCIMALYIIWDATGFRRQLGWHAKELNKLIWLLEEYDRTMFKRFVEKLGHKPVEVFVGAVFGVALTLLLYYCLL